MLLVAPAARRRPRAGAAGGAALARASHRARTRPNVACGRGFSRIVRGVLGSPGSKGSGRRTPI